MGESPEERLMTSLVEEHGDAVAAFVRRYEPDRTRVQDVLQETFLRVWRNLETIDVRTGNPRAYLLTVARNVLTDRWRASERRPRLVRDDEALASAPSGDDTEAALEGWLVAEALSRLRPEHREVLQALHYEGRTVAEAARVLGIPAGTVKSRSHYALRALRAVLEEMGVIA